MIWADRLALIGAVLLFIPLFVIGVCIEGVHSPNPVLLPAYAIVYVILPVWVMLRLIDLITGGPRRRRFMVPYR